MIRQVEVENKTTKFNNTVTNSHGGFIQYWGLTKQLYQETKKLSHILPTTKQKISMWSLFWIKVPWWCFLKPMYQFISIKKNFTGTFVYIKYDGKLQEQTFRNAKKEVTLELVTIPVFKYTASLSNQDRSYLMKQLI